MQQIDLHRVADALASTGPGTTVYLDRRNGECVEINDAWDGLDDFVEDLDLEADHWFELPDSDDRNEWRMMERFAASQEKPEHQERLLRAIHGRGAFRVFRDAAHELGLIQLWYAFLHDETVALLRPYLDDAGIAYHERGRRPDGAGTGT